MKENSIGAKQTSKWDGFLRQQLKNKRYEFNRPADCYVKIEEGEELYVLLSCSATLHRIGCVAQTLWYGGQVGRAFTSAPQTRSYLSNALGLTASPCHHCLGTISHDLIKVCCEGGSSFTYKPSLAAMTSTPFGFGGGFR